MGLGLVSDKFFNVNLEEREIKISSGNLFVFYSDGLTESMNNIKEEYGTEEVLKVMILTEIVRAIPYKIKS